VHFDATSSYDEAGRIATFYWGFGDGQIGSGSGASHNYAYRGDYQVRLTLVNDDHEQNTVEHTIHIQGGNSPLDIVPVFVNGSVGYACYGIPSIIRSTNGDLVAYAEGRLKEYSDATPVIRIVCKRSSDNRQSWGSVQVVARNVLGDHGYGCMNCSPVVDTVHGTGRIIVVFNKKEFSEWDIARGKGINRSICIFSDDHGRTWHGEKDITFQCTSPTIPAT
jgi:sialidase-1